MCFQPYLSVVPLAAPVVGMMVSADVSGEREVAEGVDVTIVETVVVSDVV